MNAPRLNSDGSSAPLGIAGKAAIVTGASSGIGAAIARHLAREGGRVIAVGRDQERLSDSAGEITGDGQCIPVVADLVAPGAPAQIVEIALERFSTIDLVVHAAGIFRLAPFAEAGPDVLDEQYEINVRAPYALTHAALPHLARGSTVIFVSSNLAQKGMAGAAAYCASKGAVDAMTRALAVELAPGIRVNSVAPGIVRTPMTHRLEEDEEQRAAALGQTPAGRFAEPEEIAATVAFLASDACRYMIGSTVVIDGGWNAH